MEGFQGNELFPHVQSSAATKWAATEIELNTMEGLVVVCPYICEMPGEDGRWHFTIDIPDVRDGVDANGFPTRARSLASGYGFSRAEVETAVAAELSKLERWFRG